MTRRLVRHTACGAAFLAVCAGFGWLVADFIAILNRHVDNA